MDRAGRVPQLYGYTVCLISVVVFLISTNALIENAFSLADPLRAEPQWYGPGDLPVTSFEAYQAAYESASERTLVELGPGATPGRPRSEPLSEAELRARYQVLRADRIAQNRFRALRSLTTSGLMLLLAVVLFGMHWRWLRTAAPRGAA